MEIRGNSRTSYDAFSGVSVCDDFLVLLFNFFSIQAKGTYNYSVNPLASGNQFAVLLIMNLKQFRSL